MKKDTYDDDDDDTSENFADCIRLISNIPVTDLIYGFSHGFGCHMNLYLFVRSSVFSCFGFHSSLFGDYLNFIW